MGTRRLAAVGAFVIAAVAGVAAGGCEGCEGGGLTDAAPPDAPAPGTFSLSWSVTDMNGQPVTCEQVGAQVVTLTVRNIASVNGETAVFSCSSASGTTQPFVPGTYVIDFELVDTTGPIATLPRRGGLVIEPGRDTPLGALTFVVGP